MGPIDVELIALVRAGIALVLVSAGVAKAADLTGFSETLAQLVGTKRKLLLAAIVVASGEIALGLASLIGAAPGSVNLVVLAVAAVFVLVRLYGVLALPDVNCKCFGALGEARFSAGGVMKASLFVFAAAAVVLRRGVVVGPSYWSIGVLCSAAILILAVHEAASGLARVQRRGSIR